MTSIEPAPTKIGSPARVMVGGDRENLEREQDAPTGYTVTKIMRTGARCSH
ncbi:hypothetical protein [Okeania sp. KiyG1]|uniref:hypothetical protein n=1 Tax=Okeania sp. KiyG1 TaxID=2720165 RepID=UPI0019232FFE|nr:hypothetical protein [Okeania sp. KiyG1]